ncbi:hypothetical protein QTN47_07070 [Danxiaibacter flavus]|uniref:Intradiol ring-cleavage dioxygenases domain-containing protein n=1 Tax=Danxiaibacter flavus TaxID=3049108 RepID=A0ABV3ZBK5_9BACT|nr:hypothetical protein QNM32_07070 [Chitinophagaceae bacterium DXS]
MNRTRFLALIGLSFVASFLSSARRGKGVQLVTDCNDPITPPVNEGPYYKDEKLNRADIRESRAGVPITYLFMVEDKHCKPVEGAIVDIWQCDAEGRYSDFEAQQSLNQTWLRGYQKTDKKGECKFQSIFPGWYNGRLTHLHLKVHVNNSVALTSNLFFPKHIEEAVYKNPLYPKGLNNVTVAQDIELHGDKDESRFKALTMEITKDGANQLVGKYKIALT